MRDFVITTDSNSDLPLQYIREKKIGIIPHYYNIDGEIYGEERNLSAVDFYNIMREGLMPTTMASNPIVIHDTFQRYLNQGLDILHISFSSALSGGYSNVYMGAKELSETYQDAKINVVDSLNVSLGQGMLIMKAVELKELGKSLDEITDWMEQHKKNFCVQFTVDDLHHLHRGGRVSKATAVLGSMINIKPILYVNDEGSLVSLSTVRGRKKSLNILAQNLEEQMGKYKAFSNTICIVHGDAKEDANFLKDLIKDRFSDKQIIINTISPSIGAHSGPGAIGICFMGESRN